MSVNPTFTSFVRESSVAERLREDSRELSDAEEGRIIEVMFGVPKGETRQCPLCGGALRDYCASDRATDVRCSKTPWHRVAVRGI